MPICKLCQLEKPLQDSHIVPEFIYKWGGLYNEAKHVMMGINGAGCRGWKPLQKGVREHLLCQECERLLNEWYEKPFQRGWFEERPLPRTMGIGDIFDGAWDYASFKLFHLSILFRCGVSTLQTFEEVSLESHEGCLRNMLLSQDPGKADNYPIFGNVVINNCGEVERRIISRPIRKRYDGHIAYEQIYAGVRWCISVSSHLNPDFCQGGLQPDGRMALLAVDWKDIGVLQDAGKLLSQENQRGCVSNTYKQDLT
ncbi:MAG: hypothetical protein ACD_13C00029G0002 [uncultured bacterium]|nr:MAG: hypothetical protein ACD_13C00029G0002 [uncultured bacterium]